MTMARLYDTLKSCRCGAGFPETCGDEHGILKDIKMRILVCEGDTNFIASTYASYRWQNRESFSPTSFYVFSDYLALISFRSKNAPKVIFLHSEEFANAYRQQFMDEWKRAKEPKKK